MADIQQLYQSLKERKRPEDVAEMILELPGNSLNPQEINILEKAAKGSLARNIYGYTSMLQTFAETKGAGKQVAKAREIFNLSDPVKVEYHSAKNIEEFIQSISPLIHKTAGKSDFKADRLNKSQRKESGLDISKRNYNKKWRLLIRLEKKLLTIIRENKKISLYKISRHGLAHTLSFSDFSSDLNTACFIAYYNARCNLRSVFTNQSQERPFDDICEMLLNRCKNAEKSFFDFFKKNIIQNKTNWWAIAHIYTSCEVMDHLSGHQKGLLLGKWTRILQETADMLAGIWQDNDINRTTMVVKKGNDSTTWNNTAGAWNKARDHWMQLIYSIGLDSILDDVCFGKVLRLMAADVVSWHLSSGGHPDPDTAVWNQLPLPWEVFQNKTSCNRDDISYQCRAAGIDPEKSGWIAPRLNGVVAFKPTPELVNGVMVSSPFLATILKKQKYFSG